MVNCDCTNNVTSMLVKNRTIFQECDNFKAYPNNYTKILYNVLTNYVLKQW